MRNLKFAPIAFVGLMLFTGCSFTQAKLVVPDDGAAALCGPAGNNGEIFVGFDYLRNDGKTLAEITNVELVEANNLELRGFGILSNTQTGDRGTLKSDEATLSSDRSIAVGDTSAVQVVLGLSNAKEPGKAKSLRVTYGNRDGKNKRSITTVTTLDVLPTEQSCQ